MKLRIDRAADQGISVSVQHADESEWDCIGVGLSDEEVNYLIEGMSASSIVRTSSGEPMQAAAYYAQWKWIVKDLERQRDLIADERNDWIRRCGFAVIGCLLLAGAVAGLVWGRMA